MIVKDPIAALSSDWLARNVDFEVVVLVRHPAAFAASLKRLNWRFPLEHFLEQEIESKSENSAEQAAIIWECIYGVLFAYVDSNANWLVRKHEALSGSPVVELGSLCKALGLEWTKSGPRR